MKKEASINCNPSFMRIYTVSCGIHVCWDPKFVAMSFPINENVIILGNSLIVALNRSRTLTPKDDDYLLLSWTGQKDLYKLEIKETIKKYNYKNKKSLFEHMQSCSVEMDVKNIVISPWNHEKLDSWDGINKKFVIAIPSISSPAVVGAAVKYSIARCTGKGADLVAKKLFPDGVPDTFEDYIKSLNLQHA
jgi:hypothetical protein